MGEKDIFLSVGAAATDEQETFIRAVEDRLRAEGLVPHTLGRSAFSADAPLKTVMNLMDKCAGTVVLAIERSYFPRGIERRGGPKESPVAETRYPTTWNQIEAAMAYSRGHPLLILIEQGLRHDGLLERGYDWYVQSVSLSPASLLSAEFNGVFADWKEKLKLTHSRRPMLPMTSELTVGELMRSMKPSALWAVLVAIATLIIGSFSLGAFLFREQEVFRPTGELWLKGMPVVVFSNPPLIASASSRVALSLITSLRPVSISTIQAKDSGSGASGICGLV
jgi:hypothetical protein